MKSYNIQYSNYENLKKFININDINKAENILVQVFTGITNKDFIEEIIKNLVYLMPKCKIIGATSAAEIYEGNAYIKSCIISITVFEETKIKTILVKSDENDFQKGQIIGDKLINKDTKAIISFISMNVERQKFLDGINSIDSNTVVAGGVAGNSEYDNEVCVFTEEGIGTNAVAAALDSEKLIVNNESTFNWVPIGKEHEITDVEGTIIKTIEGIPAKEFYKKYTGIKDDNIIMLGTQFPLMVQKDDTYISIPVWRFTEDNGIVVVSNIERGEKVRIGYGDLGEISRGISEVYTRIMENPIESIYIYSCDSRKRFLKDMIRIELSPLDNNSIASGFYTFGEFNHINDKNIFCTETLTMLMLSENENSKIDLNVEEINNCKNYNDNDTALYNLIKTTGEELNELNLKLEEKVQEKTLELRKQYYKDSLTGLFNRNKLISDLADKKYNNLAIIDLNSFNGINDFYGNELGNAVLIELAEVIKGYCYEIELKVYRLGGDIFAVTSKSNLIEDFIKKAKELQGIINNRCFLPDTYKIYLSASVGLANEEDKLLEKTEMALNYGKRNKETFQIYKKELKLYEKIEENIVWASKIKYAISQNRIVPYFQPIVNNHLEVTEKFESLIRMIDEDGQVIPPGYFLDVAKKSGIYKDLTRIMIEKTFEVLNKTNYEISINLLLQDIMSKVTRDLIIEKLKMAENPKRVVFEIVESEGIENFDEVVEFIKDVKKCGAKIAIDDFGTGYSNFSYLMKLNVDYIKIDGSLVKNIHKDKSAEIIIKTLVSFAKELGIETIAEFVADEQVYNKIKKLNIDFSQGYYISEPKPQID